MKKRKLMMAGLLCAAAGFVPSLASAARAQGSAADEIKRLAELMPLGAPFDHAQGKQAQGWAGAVVADIGAGDGQYAFAAAERVGTTGRVYATEIDAKKLG